MEACLRDDVGCLLEVGAAPRSRRLRLGEELVDQTNADVVPPACSVHGDKIKKEKKSTCTNIHTYHSHKKKKQPRKTRSISGKVKQTFNCVGNARCHRNIPTTVVGVFFLRRSWPHAMCVLHACIWRLPSPSTSPLPIYTYFACVPCTQRCIYI